VALLRRKGTNRIELLGDKVFFGPGLGVTLAARSRMIILRKQLPLHAGEGAEGKAKAVRGQVGSLP